MNQTVLTQDDVRLIVIYWIEKNDRSITYVAKNVDISRSHLSVWLNGHSNLREKNLQKLIEFCK